MMSEKVCDECQWWDRHHLASESVGVCRRYAPKSAAHVFTNPTDEEPFVYRGGVVSCGWPTTISGEWCGEFEQREPDKDGPF